MFANQTFRNMIKISFENDDREFEVDEDTIKKIPFLQSHYNFNKKSEVIKLDCIDHDEFKLVLDTIVDNRIDLTKLFENHLNSFFDSLDFLGVMSKPLGKGYKNYLMDSIKDLSNDEHYEQLIETQNFINNKEEQIISMDIDLLTKLIPDMTVYKNIIPYYNLYGSIFFGRIPFPIKSEGFFSLNKLIINKFEDIVDDNGKINKLFLTTFCFIFGLPTNCFDRIIDKDWSFSQILNDIRYYYDRYCFETICAEFGQKCVKVILKNYKLISKYGEKYGNNGMNWSDYTGNHDIAIIKEKISKMLTVYNNLLSELVKNDYELYLTEEELNIIENRDKYIKIISDNCTDFDCGFIKKIE
ncbi:hypothetical protein Catovirus_1_521 [Catovirus CTV1]|uniref:Uncharacterized protein n=1 Tax=Catovirus CTV1 TaxID=1977631 RepID=A0A1V0S9V4_9VIRU|nr:hypothetical protein Catovirus_1_521 [Catovirus CTV1]